jgi:hypothetical protein
MNRTDETAERAEVLAHTKGLEQRVDGIERAVDVLGKRFDRVSGNINDKLDALARAVTLQAAQPQFSITAMLQVVVMCTALLGSGATATIWIATSIAAGPVAELRTKLDHERDSTRRLERMIERLADRIPDRIATR